MAISKVIGSTTYSVPTQGQRGWGSDVTNLLARLADVANQVVTANYIITTDTFFRDSSGMFGLKSNFLKGVGAIASSEGFLRMASPHANPGQGELFPGGAPEGRSYTYLSWRNSLNNADLHLFPNTDNATLKFAGVNLVNLDAPQSLSNKFLDSTNSIDAATIPDGAITNIKVSNIAAIDLGKLAPQAINSAAEFGPTGFLQPSGTTTTQLSYLVGVTSNIQTQLNAKVTANANITAGTAAKITYDVKGLVTAGTSLVAADIPTGISAANIGAGAVDNTEFGYLDGVTSAIQTQLNAKQGTGAYITALSGDVTASGPGSAAATIAALAVTTGKINDLAVTDTKLNTSAVTTAKIQDLAVTSAKVAAGLDAVKIGAGTVSNTVFGYLAGVSSAIQTQLDAKIPAAILTAKGDLLTRNSTVNTNLAVGTNGQYLKADSTTATGLAWADIVAGGSGEKNYIGNPNSSTNWVASNAAQMTIATEAVQANLPDNVTQLTGLRFTRISGAAYVYYRFTLDAVDYNKKLKIVKDMKFAGAANDYRVEVYSNTLSNYTGTSTQLTVAPTGNLPGNTTGQVSMTFDSSGSSAPYIEVRVVGVAGTAPLYINNFLVGPGVLGQVPAVGPQTSYSASIGAVITPPTPGTGFQIKSTWARDGEFMDLNWEFLQVNAGSAGSGTYLFPLPSGYTIDTSKLIAQNTDGLAVFGSAEATSNTNKIFGNVVGYNSTNVAIRAIVEGASANTFGLVGSGLGGLGNINTAYSFRARIPIAEWAGSGTVNLGAGAQPSYASNSSVTTATDTTSFQYGEDGALVQAFAPAGTASVIKRVRSPYPNPKYAILQFKPLGRNWVIAQDYGIGFKTNDAGTTYYGTTLTPQAGGVDFDIDFYSTPYPGNTWSNLSAAGGRWRVVFADTPAAVGFGLATATDSGLVSREVNGTFTGTLTGATTSPSVTYNYTLLGRVVTLQLNSNITVTKNGSTGVIGITGLPSIITPAATAYATGGATVAAGVPSASNVWAETSGQLTYYRTAAEDTFSAGSAITLVRCTITYKI